MVFFTFIVRSVFTLLFIHPLPLQLSPGDILFQDLDCGDLCDAIEKVTEGYEGRDFSHVGLVVRSGDTLAVVEAIGGSVKLTGLKAFWARSGKIVAGRIKGRRYKHYGDRAAAAALAMIGVPYDDPFLPDNGRLYCSEVVALAFQAANNGKPFFPMPNMTFKDPDTGDFFPAWVAYYKELNQPIPEGVPGCNPGGLSRDGRVKIFWVWDKN